MYLEITTRASGNSPYIAVIEMLLRVLGATIGQGLLRLRKNLASRSSYSAQDDSLFGTDGSPAKAICAPHFSARSTQRGFRDSISAIFFLLTHRFSCFSRSIAFVTSSKPS